MKTVVLLASLALISAQPVLADGAAGGIKSTLMIFRDSDGIVISVNHPIDYFTPMPGGSTMGGVVYTMGGVQVEFSTGPGLPMTNQMASGGEMTAGDGPTAVVGSTTYKVEVSGNAVFLRDSVTGALYPTEQRVAAVSTASGLQVNPTGFAMD